MEEKNLPKPKVFLPDLVTVVASPATRMAPVPFFQEYFCYRPVK
jgi:hypothetical protein